MRILIHLLPLAFILSLTAADPVVEIDNSCRLTTEVDGELRKFLLVEQIGDGDIVRYTNLTGEEKKWFIMQACSFNEEPKTY